MLEGKCEENRVPKDIRLISQKNKMSKNKTKMLKKRNQEKWRIKEKMMKKKKK